MTVIEFKPHSGNRRNPAPQRPCVSPRGQHKHATPSPEVSPDASGHLWPLAVALSVFALLMGFAWVIG